MSSFIHDDARTKPPTRRTILRITAPAALAALAGPAQGQGITPFQAQYRNFPNGSEECLNCRYFHEQMFCRIVIGEVMPGGWCTYYKAKGLSGTEGGAARPLAKK